MVKQLFAILALVSTLALPATLAQAGVTILRRRKSKVDASIPAEYTCTLTNLWLPDRHPIMYPGDASFDSIILASHNANYALFGPGDPARLPIKDVAADGDTGNLSIELFFAKGNDVGDFVLEFGISASNYSSKRSTVIAVNGSYPLLSAVTKMEPSPDWIVGLQNLNMVNKADNTFYSDVIANISPWDAGVFTGNTYDEDDPDNTEEDPQKPIQLLTKKNAPSTKVLLSPEGGKVLPVMNIHCFLSSVRNSRSPLKCNGTGDSCTRNGECRCRRNVCRPSPDGLDTCLPCLVKTQTCTQDGECCNKLVCTGGVCNKK